MGNEQKQLITMLTAQLQKQHPSKKRRLWKLNDLLLEDPSEWEKEEKNGWKSVMIPPLELMGKLESSLGLCEELLCSVAKVVGEESKVVGEVKVVGSKEGDVRNGANDVFWEQFLTEIPGSSNAGEVIYLNRRNNVVN